MGILFLFIYFIYLFYPAFSICPKPIWSCLSRWEPNSPF